MKLLFRILQSSFTDKLAYVSAVAGALCWLIHARYPALFPGPLKATAHIYTTIVASLAAGMLIAKYVFTGRLFALDAGSEGRERGVGR